MNGEQSITKEIEHLYQMINSVQSCVEFSIIAFLTTIGIAVAIVGVALYFIAMSAINRGIEKGVENFKAEYFERMTNVETQLEQNNKDIAQLVYEEIGTWTPELNYPGCLYGNQTGKYYRIGKVVITWFNIEILKLESNSFNSMAIKGLPFISNSEEWCDVIIINPYESGEGSTDRIWKGHLSPMNNIIEILNITSGLYIHRHPFNAEINEGTVLRGTMIYRIE